MGGKVLTAEVQHTVNFNEVDMMGVVWHGHYLRYFEMAREAFARKHGIDVEALMNARVRTPIVKADVKYKAPARYGQRLIIEAAYRMEREPKFVLKFRITDGESGQLLAVGRTTQIFTNPDGDVYYFPPPLLKKFWEKWGGDK